MAAAKFKNGGKPGPGRPKGAPNKNTAELKAMILEALDKAGGVDYLLKCAKNTRTQGAFLALIGKVLPMTVAGDPDAPLTLVINENVVRAPARD